MAWPATAACQQAHTWVGWPRQGKKLHRFATAVTVLLALASAAPAQEVHDRIRPSLVYLEATGEVETSPGVKKKEASFGTGFLVSSDGLVLTTHDLISSLGDVVPASVRILAH